MPSGPTGWSISPPCVRDCGGKSWECTELQRGLLVSAQPFSQTMVTVTPGISTGEPEDGTLPESRSARGKAVRDLSVASAGAREQSGGPLCPIHHSVLGPLLHGGFLAGEKSSTFSWWLERVGGRVMGRRRPRPLPRLRHAPPERRLGPQVLLSFF